VDVNEGGRDDDHGRERGHRHDDDLVHALFRLPYQFWDSLLKIRPVFRSRMFRT
jgi:hypothetical protein